MTKYRIEPIGSEFSNKAIKGLQERMNAYGEVNYKFHSVFQVQRPGCLGIGNPTITYLAVYCREENSDVETNTEAN